MLTKYYEEIAAIILNTNVESLPDSLLSRLDQINEMVQRVGPGKELCSSQIIALIIYQWQREELEISMLK